MPHFFKTAALAAMAPVMVLTATPALADNGHHRGWYKDRGDRYEQSYRDDYRYRDYRPDYRGDYRQQVYYGEPVYANTRTWRGDDGRYYCRRSDGTTGFIIGGVAGALIGREVAGRRGDRTLGAILGAAGGALLGREIDRSGSSNGYRCR